MSDPVNITLDYNQIIKSLIRKELRVRALFNFSASTVNPDTTTTIRGIAAGTPRYGDIRDHDISVVAVGDNAGSPRMWRSFMGGRYTNLTLSGGAAAKLNAVAFAGGPTSPENVFAA